MKGLREKREGAYIITAVGLPGIISENASQEESPTFKWLKRTLYRPQNRSLVGYWKLDGNAEDGKRDLL